MVDSKNRKVEILLIGDNCELKNGIEAQFKIVFSKPGQFNKLFISFTFSTGFLQE